MPCERSTQSLTTQSALCHGADQNVHSPNQDPAPWETHDYPSWSPGRGSGKTMQICATLSPPSSQLLLIELGWVDANMLDMLDSGLANVSTALTQAQMWQHTLLVFSAVRPPSLPPAQNRLELKTVRSFDLSICG